MRRAAIALIMAAWAMPASAGFPVEIEMTCPVGGETFTHITTGSYSTFGQRPDGKPYGSWVFPLALPECPSNALVLYRDFKPDELPKLTTLVLSPEYQALKSETPYFRAAWLAERMDSGDQFAGAFLLLSATWEADWDPAIKSRYQRAFATAASSKPVDPLNSDSLFLRYRLANAYRELGEFAAASAALDTLPLHALDVALPTGNDSSYEAEEDARSRRFLLEAIPLMREVIAAGDRSPEPLELMADDYVASVCADMIAADASVVLPSRCNEPAISKTTKEFLENRRASEEGTSAEEAAEAAASVVAPPPVVTIK
jgi:hypothetical protein